MEGSWETVHVLFAKADTGTGAVTCQTGDILTGSVSDANSPVFGSWGVLSLPAVPIAGVSAPEAIVLKSNGIDVVIGGRSVRSAAIAGQIDQGETAVFADGSQGLVLIKLDGSVNMLTTHDNTVAGRNVGLRLAPDGLKFEWPWSRLKCESDGLHYDHTSGLVFDLGVVDLSGPFAILSPYKTYFNLRADMGRIQSSFLSMGPAGSIKAPAARADALMTVLQAMQAEIAAIAQTVVAMAATPAASGVSPGATVAVTRALGTQATALSNAVAAIAVGVAGTVPLPGPIGSKCLAIA